MKGDKVLTKVLTDLGEIGFRVPGFGFAWLCCLPCKN